MVLGVVVVGCSKPPGPTPPIAAKPRPAVITKAATPYGEVKLVATIRTKGDTVELRSPDGGKYTGEQPDTEYLKMFAEIVNDAKPHYGYLFQFPDDFPATAGDIRVSVGGKSVTGYSYGPPEQTQPGKSKFADCMVKEGAGSGEDPIQVRISLKPDHLEAKGQWKTDSTVTVSDVGYMTIKSFPNGDIHCVVNLTVDGNHRDRYYTLKVFDASGKPLPVRSAGAFNDESGYPMTSMWAVVNPNKAARFEVWSGDVVTAEFFGVTAGP